jgi:uncharacterized protein YndB with AHSA1/START domain
MKTATKNTITVQSAIEAPKEKVWENWTSPSHIVKWCFASEDWHAPHAENDLRVDGKFKTTMAAKDGSFSFEFEGFYTLVENLKKIVYQIADGRQVEIEFDEKEGKTFVTETFEAEDTHPLEMQKAGWQSILDNFKKYVESQQ